MGETDTRANYDVRGSGGVGEGGCAPPSVQREPRTSAGRARARARDLTLCFPSVGVIASIRRRRRRRCHRRRVSRARFSSSLLCPRREGNFDKCDR